MNDEVIACNGFRVDQAMFDAWHQETAQAVTQALEEYRLHIAAETIYQYIWTTLADKLIEESKPILFGEDVSAKHSRAQLLYRLLIGNLALLHPFMPFVTESIWQLLPEKQRPLLMTELWPTR